MSVTGSCSKCGSNAVIRSDGSVTELGMKNKKTRKVPKKTRYDDWNLLKTKLPTTLENAILGLQGCIYVSMFIKLLSQSLALA